MSLRFEAGKLRWKVDAQAPQAEAPQLATRSRERVVGALRAAGKPVV